MKKTFDQRTSCRPTLAVSTRRVKGWGGEEVSSRRSPRASCCCSMHSHPLSVHLLFAPVVADPTRPGESTQPLLRRILLAAHLRCSLPIPLSARPIQRSSLMRLSCPRPIHPKYWRSQCLESWEALERELAGSRGKFARTAAPLRGTGCLREEEKVTRVPSRRCLRARGTTRGRPRGSCGRWRSEGSSPGQLVLLGSMDGIAR